MANSALIAVIASAVVPAGDEETLRARMREGGTVCLAAGVHQVAVSGKESAIVCPRSVRLVGEGRDQSIIRTETDLTATGFLFQFDPGTQDTIAALAIQGPEKVGEFQCRLLWHLAGPDGLLRIDQCKLSGGTFGVIMEERDGRRDSPRLTVLDSTVACRTGLHLAGGGYLDAVRTEFSQYGTAGSNKEHAIYVYSDVSASVDRCAFFGSAGDGFDIVIPVTPGRGRLTLRDTEHQGKGRGILTHPSTMTVIRGCRLGMVTVEVQRGGVVVSDTSLREAGQVKPYPWGPAGSIVYRDCRFGE